MASKWIWIAGAAVLLPAGVYLAYKPLSGLPDLSRLAESKHAYSPLRVAELYDKSHLLRMQHEDRVVVDGPMEETDYTPEELLQMYQEMYGEPVELVEGKYIPVSWKKNPVPPPHEWFSGSREEYGEAMLENIEQHFLEQVRQLNPKHLISADMFSRCPSGYGYYAEDENGAKDGACWFVLVFWDGCDEERMCTFRYTLSDQAIMVKVGENTGLVTVENFIEELKVSING